MQDGAKVYSPLVLGAYDLWVLALSNRFAWKCPTPVLLDVYRRNASENHLDIGVGTGWYLSHLERDFRRLVLMDLNPNSLAACSARVQKQNPKSVVADALQPFPSMGEKFDSVGMMYLLHCLPGTIESKAALFRNASNVLNPDGRLFGATICGANFRGNFAARKLNDVYNRKGIFSNREDDPDTLGKVLRQSFREVKVTTLGNVTIFEAVGVKGN